MNNKKFESFKLGNDIIKSLEKLSYKAPTEVQEKVIPVVLEKKDIIVKSQTGSGKTAAFAIPICENIEVESKEPQVLILTPTRELAVQVKEDITNIGRYKKIRSVAVFGKHSITIQRNELRQRVHVIVGTPGRTMDHIKKGNINLAKIKYLVLDEADEMLSMGFIEQVEEIMNTLPSEKITLLFSATMPSSIELLAEKHMKNAVKIDITPKTLTVEKINQIWYEVEEENKFNVLERVLFIENPDSCIIFCRTKENVEKLANKIKNKYYNCKEIHGGMLQKDRLDTMKQFKRGEFRFLVATDVAARGIDVEKITHIINYDIPLEKDRYVHRIGRTGRSGSKGIAITFVTPYEKRFLQEIEEYINYEIPKKEVPSIEFAQKNKEAFIQKNNIDPKIKKDKGSELNKDIMKLFINAGKKKKIRAGDIVGSITNLEGIEVGDIGIIDIQDNFSYIDILNGKGYIVLDGLKKSTVKGKSVRVQKAYN